MIDMSDVFTDPDLVQDIPVTRATETVDGNGRTALSSEALFMTGTILPAEDKLLERLPEADRSGEIVAVYSTGQLTSGTETLAPDKVTWRGETYEVLKVLDYLEVGGFCVALARAASMHGREIGT